MTRLVIFGERPGPNTDPLRPLYPHTTTGAAARLMKLLDMDRFQYITQTKRYNVVDDMVSRTTEIWVRDKTERRMILHRAVPGTRFVFLGRAAAQAAPPPYRNLAFGEPKDDVLVIPHPSGRNRFYNSEANTRLIEESLRKFARRFSEA